MSHAFDNIQGRFGFGFMRLPIRDGKILLSETQRMVDAFMASGFNYFDTAHGYLDGRSEPTLRHCLTSRYPRESYVLTNKLSSPHFHSNEEIRPLFESQLEACGVSYFDFYLMHAQDRRNFEKYKRNRAYETALELKAEGKIRHLGISFHDKAEVLDQILTEYPQIEVVQIQFNYQDYDDASVESRKCYEVCCQHGKPVIVMEPVKGGCLVNLPDEAKKVLDDLHGGSYASYAVRFAASFPEVMMVLSGMSSLSMVEENCGFMSDFQPLNDKELAAIDQVKAIIRSKNLIQCTTCRYCTEVCPQSIPIPSLFACYNAQQQFHNWNTGYYFRIISAKEGTSPDDCTCCGNCESVCPQHLHIRQLLPQVAKEFEK